MGGAVVLARLALARRSIGKSLVSHDATVSPNSPGRLDRRFRSNGGGVERSSRVASAIPSLNSAREMSTSSSSLRTALQRHQSGDLATAEQLYREVLLTDPRNADAHHLLGLIALAQGRHQDAIEHIREAIACDSRPADFHRQYERPEMAEAGPANRCINSQSVRVADNRANWKSAAQCRARSGSIHF